MKVPNYFEISTRCFKKVISNFVKKGDTWINPKYEPDMINNLEKHLSLYKLTHQPDDLLDIINLCCMIYHRRAKLK